jgi:hypothetical protein
LSRLVLEVVCVPQERSRSSDAVLELEVVVPTDTENAVEFLSPKPIVQILHAACRTREAIQGVTAVNQDITAQNTEFLVQVMRVTDDNDPQDDNPFV